MAPLKRGAGSPRLVGPLSEALAEALVAGTPAAAPTFALARGTLCRKLAQLQLVALYVHEHGPLDPEGEPRPAARYELDLLATVEKSMASMGLTPDAAARLGVDLLRGETIIAMDEARRIREDAERRHAGDVR